VGSTSEIGIFKILSEGSVGANVRRIEAITGRAAVAYYRERDRIVTRAAAALGTTEGEILGALDRLQARVESLETEVKGLLSENAKDTVPALVAGAARYGEVSIVAEVVGARDMDHLLSLVDQVRDRIRPGVVILGAALQGKGALVVSATPGLNGIDAGAIVKSAAREFGGGGGGTAQLGRGGGGDPSRLGEAVSAARIAVVNGLGV